MWWGNVEAEGPRCQDPGLGWEASAAHSVFGTVSQLASTSILPAEQENLAALDQATYANHVHRGPNAGR